MDFHGRLSPPEDSTKSPQWEQAHAELMFTLVWTFSIFLNSSKTLTADPASSNFAITQLATGTSPQLSAKDAIPEEHKNISTCPPPLRHSSGRNTKQSNFTSRGNMKDTLLLLTTRFPLGDQAQACPMGEGAACLPSHHSTGAPSLTLKDCCQTHWGAYTQAGQVLQAFSQHTKTKYLQKWNLPNIISFKQIFLLNLDREQALLLQQ